MFLFNTNNQTDSPLKIISCKKKANVNQTHDPTKKYLVTEMQVYHETQKQLFCGKHAVNNLLQLNQQASKKPMTVSFFGDIATEMFNNEKKVLGPNITNNHQQVVGLKRDPIGNYSFEVVSTAIEMQGCNLVHVPTITNDTEDVVKAWGLDKKTAIGLLFNVQKFVVQKYQKMQQAHANLQHPQLLQSFFQGISDKNSTEFEEDLNHAIPKQTAQQKPLKPNSNTLNFIDNETTLLPGVEIEKQPAGGHWWTIGKIYFSVSGNNKKTYVWVDHDSLKPKPKIFESLQEFMDCLRGICKRYGSGSNPFDKNDTYHYELNIWKAEITDEDDPPTAYSARQFYE